MRTGLNQVLQRLEPQLDGLAVELRNACYATDDLDTVEFGGGARRLRVSGIMEGAEDLVPEVRRLLG